MTATEEYDVAVVGGGPAGLTAALYATRLGHDTAVFDRGGGRAAMMLDTHNVVGVTEDVSGTEFLETAREQVVGYGANHYRELVTGAKLVAGGEDEATGEDEAAGDEGAAGATASGRRFHLDTDERTVAADAVVLATGFADGRPDPPLPRTGMGLHYCLHCDAYLFVDEPVYVMGHGESAAHIAMTLLNFTGDVDLLLRGDEPTWSEETGRRLDAHPVDVVDAGIASVETDDDGGLEGFAFEDGSYEAYRGGFAMYGADYNTDLAVALGCDLTDDGTIAVDDRCRTSVDGVYAVGDVTPGHNQIPVAMGEGAKAGIAVHKSLREFPKSLAELETAGVLDSGGIEEAGQREVDGTALEDAAPAVSEAIVEAARAHRASDG